MNSAGIAGDSVVRGDGVPRYRIIAIVTTAGAIQAASLFFCVLVSRSCSASPQTAEDPCRWLEEAEGERALAWVRAHSGQTPSELTAHSVFDSIYRKNLEIYGAQERISASQVRGEYGYGLLRDAAHERGIWRRTPLVSIEVCLGD